MKIHPIIRERLVSAKWGNSLNKPLNHTLYNKYFPFEEHIFNDQMSHVYTKHLQFDLEPIVEENYSCFFILQTTV